MKRIALWILIVTGLTLRFAAAENLLVNDSLKDKTGLKLAFNVPGKFPWRDDFPWSVEGGVATLNLAQAKGMKMAVFEMDLKPLTKGKRYEFSCQIKSEKPSAVIVVFPEPDAEGKTGADGKPKGNSVWKRVPASWTKISETFDYTPGLNKDKVSLFFNDKNTADSFQVRELKVVPAE